MPVPQSSRSGHLCRPGRLAALLVGVSAVLVAVGCSEPEPDPAEVRQEVVRNRLEETFSDAQVDCIMGRLDDSALQALDRDGDLDPEGEAMSAYTEAVTSCVEDPAAPAAGTETDSDQPDGDGSQEDRGP